MSELCNFENENPDPKIWGQQVLSQLNSSQLQTRISSQRFLNPRLFNATIFKNMKREYDAFEKDIAGGNFTNVLRAAFSYESFLPRFFCTYILGLKFLQFKSIGANTLIKKMWTLLCWPSLLRKKRKMRNTC